MSRLLVFEQMRLLCSSVLPHSMSKTRLIRVAGAKSYTSTGYSPLRPIMKPFSRTSRLVAPVLLACLAAPAASAATYHYQVMLGKVAQAAPPPAATPPATLAAPTSMDFGTREVGTSKDEIVAVTNAGPGNLSIGVASLSAGGPGFSLQMDTCSARLLELGQTCSIVVRFEPLTAAGYPNQLLLPTLSGDFNATTRVTLSGAGILPVALPATGRITPNVLSFGTVEQTYYLDRTVTVTNDGPGNLTTGSLGMNLANQGFTVQSDNCSARTLLPAENCVITVRFSPTDALAHNDVLLLETSAASPNELLSVSLAGTGSMTALSVSPSALDYGTVNVGSSVGARTVTVSNPNSTAVALTSIGISQLANDHTRTGSCVSGGTLAAKSSCTVSVAFSAKAVGSRPGTLSVVSGGATYSTSLTAIGQGGILELSESTYDFGATALGQSKTSTLTVRNTGNATTNLASSGWSAPFTKTGGTCSSTLAANATCTLITSYAPTAVGQLNRTLTVSGSSNVTSRTMAYGGLGAIAVLSATPSPLDFGSVNSGSTPTATITLSNTGTVATSLAMSGLSAPYSISGGTCGASLNAGSSCTVIVRFASGTGSGANTQALTIAGSTGVVPVTHSVTGLTNYVMTVSSAATDYNLLAAYTSSFGAPSKAISVTVTINSGIQVLASTSTTAAFATGTFPAGSTIKLVNRGYIIGKGGKGGSGGYSNISCGGYKGQNGFSGGPAISQGSNLTIDNASGYVLGGGGGGGGGSGAHSGSCDTASGGGGGGGGAGIGLGGAGILNAGAGLAGTGGQSGTFGLGGCHAKTATPGNCGTTYQIGGKGGAYGQDGASGSNGYGQSSGPGLGGAGGLAVARNGYTLSWTSGNTATQVKGLAP
jgi:hypothetical protein